MAMLNLVVEFGTMWIGVEGVRLQWEKRVPVMEINPGK
ncbi:hypothetical protein HNP81_003299 [Peribacillus huizhouensis]|uniref:Uncharacterized protein n=1 Tax=Peribacillus huizhouensis TaxID=1501239 RepID=A0ABR6CSI2_9BACI|nr:hypothetical protein [Peribacillus huizhouensis]